MTVVPVPVDRIESLDIDLHLPERSHKGGSSGRGSGVHRSLNASHLHGDHLKEQTLANSDPRICGIPQLDSSDVVRRGRSLDSRSGVDARLVDELRSEGCDWRTVCEVAGTACVRRVDGLRSLSRLGVTAGEVLPKAMGMIAVGRESIRQTIDHLMRVVREHRPDHPQLHRIGVVGTGIHSDIAKHPLPANRNSSAGIHAKVEDSVDLVIGHVGVSNQSSVVVEDDLRIGRGDVACGHPD